MPKSMFSKILIGLATAAFVATAGVGTIAYAQDKQEKKTTTPPKTTTKTPSACKGLAEGACKDKSAECTWVSASKGKDGKEKKAYCRSKPKAKSK